MSHIPNLNFLKNPNHNNLVEREQLDKEYGSVQQEKQQDRNQTREYDSEDGFCQKIWTPMNIGLFVGAIVIILILMILMISYK
jgi:hypothetical protein